jgi:hypothetical protein
MTLQKEMLHNFTVWCSVRKLEDLTGDAGIILKRRLSETVWELCTEFIWFHGKTSKRLLSPR